MKRGGYRLRRMEVLNWGNFQDWQVFDLSPDAGVGGPLLEGSLNSLIAGINGAGKTTLIDGLMATLLPYDQSLRLRITHDSESGSRGGAHVRDYVLGKYGAGPDGEGGSYSRGEGAGFSATLLVFEHNDRAGDFVSLGRAWWYSDSALKDDSAYFVANRDLSIGSRDGAAHLLDPDNKPFANASEFRRRMGAKDPRIQPFDTAKAYFGALCARFGGMTRDDLRLLNQAFYLKSVGSIDTFVRQYMLADKDNESISALIAHSEAAAEITANIEECELRLREIGRIVSNLETYRKNWEEKRAIERRQRLVQLHPFYDQWRAALQRERECQVAEAESLSALPGLEVEAKRWQDETLRLQSLLAASQTATAIQALEAEAAQLGKLVKYLAGEREKARAFAKQADVAFPASVERLPEFRVRCRELKARVAEEVRKANESMLKRSVELHTLKQREADLRDELQFASERKTAIPRATYALKERCMSELKLPSGALQFVGELIRVKPECESEFRRAVEAVLQPIARNLLVLPEHLDSVTRWLNKAGLERNLTVKRIRSDELEPGKPDTIEPTSILSKFEVREAGENPFHEYLWSWLSSTFYHRIVRIDEFRTAVDRAVTREGLVKQDSRTMRKNKENFEYSLGWDGLERARAIAEELKRGAEQAQKVERELSALEKEKGSVENQDRALDLLVDLPADVIRLSSFQEELRAKEVEIQKLREGDDDARRLRRDFETASSELKSAQERQAKNGARIETSRAEAEKARALATSQERELREGCSGDWDAGVAELERLDVELRERGLTATALSNALREELRDVEHKRNSNPVKAYLRDYERDHHDPNLRYTLVDDEELPSLIAEWAQARTELERTGLPAAKAKWERFYSGTLVDAVKAAINEIRMEQQEIRASIASINGILRDSDFERLPTERRYLEIVASWTQDDRVRAFLASVKQIEGLVSGAIRSLEPSDAARQTMAVLEPFVKALKDDASLRAYVTDVRNHYKFVVHSRRRDPEKSDPVVEYFAGAKTDAKSSAQTTQIAYTLLASALAYRFHFYDPVRGRDTLRLIVLDEFGGKFDNEKPRDILTLLQDMGFQAVLVSPMSKADLLAEYIGQLVLVYKASASDSKVMSFPICGHDDYERIVRSESVKGVLDEARP